MENKKYLGDSVYIGLEQGMIKLTTENGAGSSNVIYMEPQVAEEFIQYLKRYAPGLPSLQDKQ